jgi:hypothetical protein
MNGEQRNAYRLLVGNREYKKPLRRPRRRWVDNIMMDLGKIGWGGTDGNDLAPGGLLWIRQCTFNFHKML